MTARGVSRHYAFGMIYIARWRRYVKLGHSTNLLQRLEYVSNEIRGYSGVASPRLVLMASVPGVQFCEVRVHGSLAHRAIPKSRSPSNSVEWYPLSMYSELLARVLDEVGHLDDGIRHGFDFS